MRPFLRVIFWAVCALVLICATAHADRQRPFTPDDLFKLDRLGDVVFAPDGQTFAFVRRRPSQFARLYGLPSLVGSDRADIWLASVTGGAPTNLTNGESDGSGYWMPTWSPDGARLAMLSTKGGDNVRLWVLEKATGRLTKLSERGIAPWSSPMWLDSQRLVAVTLPDGEQSLDMRVDRQAANVAMREWPKTWSGRETTANVLDSGLPVNLASRPEEQLVIFHTTGHSQSIGSAVLVWQVQVAPGGRYVASFRQVSVIQPDAARLADGGDRLGINARYELEIVDLDGRVVTAHRGGPRFIVPRSFQWSRDGRSFAVIGVRQGEERGPFRVFRGAVDGTIDAVPLVDGADPRALVWGDGDRLLVSAEHEVLRDGKPKERLDWWSLSRAESPRIVTNTLTQVPADLLPTSEGRAFVGIAGGDLWRLDLASGTWTNVTMTFEPKVSAIAWPSATNSGRVDFPRVVASVDRVVIVSVSNGLMTDYYRVDVASATVSPFVRPSDLATLAAYRPDTDSAVFTADDSNGTSMTIVQGESPRRLIETNGFLREIMSGELRAIEYRSLDGEDLTGWIILPVNYQSSKRYPLVSFVYPGVSAVKYMASTMARLNYSNPLNLQLLASHGYAVLLAPMPMPPSADGKSQAGSDPYMELTKGVLPAVDKAIELGIADPKRLAVMGQSFGGYSTYGLVTLTNRFQAAIALAGPCDFISFYGTFEARSRYEPYSHEDVWPQFSLETGWGRMGNPPWKDLARYVRNSPLFYVDRVRTPVLIVQGDMDFVPIAQGEEFFTALYRQGKRARFVRYWGEGHFLASPANIRDLWMQIYAWLDEFLAAPTPTSVSSP